MKRYFQLILCLTLLVSCSEYGRVIKSDDYPAKFELANRFYAKKSYIKATTLYEQVYQRLPKTTEGEISYYLLGKSYYNLEDYILGAYYLASFSDKYPSSPKCEETSFLNVLCAVSNSPKYTLDQAETDVALNELQLFIYKYPNSSHLDSCNFLMDKLRSKLELKEVETIKLYDKTSQYKSAVVLSSAFVKTHPTSIYREHTHSILVKNSALLAIYSIESKKKERITDAFERYRKFETDFPNSRYLSELKSLITQLEGSQFN